MLNTPFATFASDPHLIGVTLLAFIFFNVVNGSPAMQELGKNASAQAIAEYDRMHGYDLPLYQQYGNFLVDLVSGDLGISLEYKQPVWTVLREGVWVSLALTFHTCYMNLAGRACRACCAQPVRAGWSTRPLLPRPLRHRQYVIW